jgi:hypothetical protein
MRRPKKWIKSCQRFSAQEDALWKELKRKYGVGRRKVALMALIELYHRAPIDLRIALYVRKKDDDPSESLAA